MNMKVLRVFHCGLIIMPKWTYTGDQNFNRKQGQKINLNEADPYFLFQMGKSYEICAIERNRAQVFMFKVASETESKKKKENISQINKRISTHNLSEREKKERRNHFRDPTYKRKYLIFRPFKWKKYDTMHC